MHSVFYSTIYEALEDETTPEPESTDIDPSAETAGNSTGDEDLSTMDNSQGPDASNSNPNAQMGSQDPSQVQANPGDDLVTKFQKYLLFLKLKDLQYKISLTEYKDNFEFKELTTLLNLILEFFSIFKYDQVFTLSTLLTEKFSKIKLEKIKK